MWMEEVEQVSVVAPWTEEMEFLSAKLEDDKHEKDLSANQSCMICTASLSSYRRASKIAPGTKTRGFVAVR